MIKDIQKEILKLKKEKNTVLEQEHILILTMKKFMENGLKQLALKDKIIGSAYEK